MNTHLRRSFYLFTLGFVALVGVLAYWQVYARESLASNPANSLEARRAQEAPRGTVLAGDGKTLLAESEPYETEDGTRYNRVYPQGAPFAGVVGYFSQRYGRSGIEGGLNGELSGGGEPETLDELVNQITGGPKAGNNVELTLDPRLQRRAYEELANSNTGRGAIVALDPGTGEVLALATYPSFDPNNIDKTLPELRNADGAPLLNRATQALYPPGSAFKVVTATAALKAGVRPTDRFVDTGKYEHRGYTVVNYGGGVYGPVDFTRALELSINTIFARIAVEIVGKERLYQTAREFGFGDSYEGFPLEVAPSRLGEGDLAQIAFGQDTVAATVFEMSLVAATVANDGKMMDPRLVREVRSPDGLILDRPTPRVREKVMDEETANTLGRMMVGVVEDGSATSARIPGVEVAGKTGTAENSQGKPHSWFIAYAPAQDPKIALAVLVENAGDGEKEAAPMAARLISSYLGESLPRQNSQGQDTQGQPGQRPNGLPFENPFNGNPLDGTPFGGGGQ